MMKQQFEENFSNMYNSSPPLNLSQIRHHMVALEYTEICIHTNTRMHSKYVQQEHAHLHLHACMKNICGLEIIQTS